MKSLLLLTLLLSATLVSSAVPSWWDKLPSVFSKERIELEITQGKLSGTIEKSANGNKFASFEGIPYAEPPVGELRFKRPQPHKGWEGVLDATSRVKCTQTQAFVELIVEGQEDCLVINVYSPKPSTFTKNSDKKSVMVYIHGGGYWWGAGYEHQAKYAMDHDIVLVTMNYRLGPLGFLASGDDVLPGNLGLWDQNLALKWVQKNIVSFGGDPDKVTVFGESAGGFSVFSHLMSPQSKGLFRAAIAMSGVTSSVWSVTDKHPAYYTRSLASGLGCDADRSMEDIVKCMKEMLSAKDFFSSFSHYMFDQLEHYPHAYQPIVDNGTSDPFFPKDPYDILKEGSFNKVPFMYGFVDSEGLFLRGQLLRDQSVMQQMEDQWDESLALIMFGRNADEITARDKKHVAQMKEAYFGADANPSKEDKLEALVELYEDSTFRAVGTELGRLYAKTSGQPAYEYLYSHKMTGSLYNLLITPIWQLLPKGLYRALGFEPFSEPSGTMHADDTFLMFGNANIPFSPLKTEEDFSANRNMWRLWTNFAKMLNPTPEGEGVIWENMKVDNPKHLVIGSKLTMSKNSPEMEERLKRWRQIWKEAPPRLHNSLESPTWKDPALYKQKINPKKTEL